MGGISCGKCLRNWSLIPYTPIMLKSCLCVMDRRIYVVLIKQVYFIVLFCKSQKVMWLKSQSHQWLSSVITGLDNHKPVYKCKYCTSNHSFHNCYTPICCCLISYFPPQEPSKFTHKAALFHSLLFPHPTVSISVS